MGIAQSSMNRIFNSASAAAVSMVGGFGKLKEASAAKNKTAKKNIENDYQPKAETSAVGGAGQFVQIRPIKRSAYYAAVGQESAQGMIQEKFGSKAFSVNDRLLEAGTSGLFTDRDKKDSDVLSRFSEADKERLKTELLEEIKRKKGGAK